MTWWMEFGIWIVAMLVQGVGVVAVLVLQRRGLQPPGAEQRFRRMLRWALGALVAAAPMICLSMVYGSVWSTIAWSFNATATLALTLTTWRLRGAARRADRIHAGETESLVVFEQVCRTAEETAS